MWNPLRSRKGQMAGNVTENMLALLIIGAVAFVSIKVFSELSTNLTAGLTGEADASAGNFSAGIWDAYGLMSIVPYIIGALVILVLIVGFARLVGVGRL